MSNILLKDLTPGQTYFIQVRADDSASVSDWSNVFNLVATSDVVPPDVPTGLTLSVVADTFVAVWDSIDRTISENLDFDHYELSLTDGTTTVVVPTIDNAYTLTFATNRSFFGTPKPTITVKVRSVDATRNHSAYSGTVSATNPAPGPVTGLAATVGVDSIDLSWTPPTDTDVIGYNVYVGTTSGFTPGSGNKLGFTAATHFTYTSTTYSLQYFKVAAVDEFNQESTYATVSATPDSPFGADVTPPATPSGLTATITTTANADLTTKAEVTWTANTETDLAGYFLRYRQNGTTLWNTVRYDKLTTDVIVQNLVPYVNYDFQIAAVDWAENMSSYSSTATGSGATNSAPSTPAAPSVSTNTMNAQVSVSGNKAAGGAMEADVNFYEVYASTTTGFTPSSANMIGTVPVGPTLVGTFQIPASGGSATQTWFFKIIAVDNGGLKSSASAQASGTPGLIAGTNIVDATIGTAKITDLHADLITAGSGLINNLTIKAILTIGTASTAGSIQSFDYSAGTAGFKIASDASGNASLEVNKGVIRAAALLIQNGPNIMPPQYADFESNASFYQTTANPVITLAANNAAVTVVSTQKLFNTQSLSYAPSNSTNSVFLGKTNTDYNIPISASTDYIISFYAMVATGGTAATLTPTLKYATATTPGTLAGSGASVPANSTWARYSSVVTVPGTAVGGSILSFSTNTSTGTVFIDGIQIEPKMSSLTSPSTWTPPGATSIIGDMVRAGSLLSSLTTTVNGNTIPYWNINADGSASFANLQVRGNAVIGLPADGAASTLSSGNFVTGTTGYQLKSDGSAEFHNVTISASGASGSSIVIGPDTTLSETIKFIGDGTENAAGYIRSTASSTDATLEIFAPKAVGGVTASLLMETFPNSTTHRDTTYNSLMVLGSDIIQINGGMQTDISQQQQVTGDLQSNQAISSGPNTVVDWDISTINGFTNATGTLTNTWDEPGVFTVSAGVTWNLGGFSGRCQIGVFLNGNAVALVATDPSSVTNFGQTITWTGSLSYHDNISIRVLQNTTTTCQILSTGSGFPFLGIVRNN